MIIYWLLDSIQKNRIHLTLLPALIALNLFAYLQLGVEFFLYLNFIPIVLGSLYYGVVGGLVTAITSFFLVNGYTNYTESLLLPLFTVYFVFGILSGAAFRYWYRVYNSSLFINSSFENGFLSVDRLHRIVYINRKAIEYLGYPYDIEKGSKISVVENAEYLTLSEDLSLRIESKEPFRSCVYVKPLSKWIELRYFPTLFGVNVSLIDVTELRKVEEERSLALRLLDNTSEGCLITDENETVVYANRAFSEITGYSKLDVLGRTPKLLRSGKHDDDFYLKLHQALLTKGHWKGLLWNRKKTGEVYPQQTAVGGISDSEGNIKNYFSLFTDVTEQKKTEDKLLISYRLIENLSEGVIITDENFSIVFVNPVFTSLTGYESEEVLGKPYDSCMTIFDVNALTKESIMTSIELDGRWQGEVYTDKKDGTISTNLLTIIPIDIEEGTVYYASVFVDITDRKKHEERMQRLAFTDTLTSLPNRVSLKNHLDDELRYAELEGKIFAVLFLDLDRFKLINDTLGHDFGDRLLDQVATRLKNSVRRTDFVSRQGGDEFTILLKDLTKKEDAYLVAEKIISAISVPYVLDNKELHVTTSIGISFYPDDGTNVDELTRKADAAMYRAKESGKNRYWTYTSEMAGIAFERLSIENDLRRAIERNELELYYQPQIDARDNRIVGVESLIRWNHPERGMVPPMSFIPIAEEIGLINEIGEWVIRTACHQNVKWQQEGYPPITVTVNLSVKQFNNHNLVNLIQEALDDSGLSPSFLEFELTESCLIQNIDNTIRTLNELKALGVSISVDDFGTGYSSLSYLKRFPIDILKIDKSFINDIAKDSDDEAITTAIISLSKSLNMDVIAEGVETEEQKKFLLSRDCREMQGYLFSPPVRASRIEEFFRERVFQPK